MSRDIRSFFVVKNKKNDLNNTSSKLSLHKPGHKKRSFVISDSDSDEESSPANPKRSKKDVKETKNKKPEVPESKSKYFEKHNVSVEDIFASKPVKRDTSRKIIKKTASKEEKEIHIDKELEAELLKLDDVGLCMFPEEGDIEINKNDLRESQNKTTPEKVETYIRKSPRKIKCYTDDGSPKKKLKIERKNYSPVSEIKKNRTDEIESPSKSSCSNKKSPMKWSPLKSPSPKKTPNKVLSPLKSLSPKKSPNKLLSPLKSPSPKKSPNKLLSPLKSPSPKKSPNKHSQLSKSHLKQSALENPVKSPFKKLSITKSKEQNKKSIKLNGGIASHSNKSNVSETREESEVLVPVKKEFSPKRTSKSADEGLPIKSNDSSLSANVEVKNIPESISPSNLWVERYKPTVTKQIIGQQGEKSCVNKLIKWLKNWDKNHSGNRKFQKPSPWAKNDDGAFFKAALLSGPPGVGKTTTAHLVCKELGFDVVEFNASDTRSKKLLHQEVSELLSTKSLSPYFTGKGDQVTKQHVLLMDEVDGMAGNEDRGGVQELITLIKQSRIPVVCMCNDRNHPKIRSLSNYCFDLRFSKPRVEQIRGAMMSVCFKEKLKMTPDALTEIITSANQDIRLIMNHLSMLAIEKTSLANSKKHIKMGPWDIVRKIFSEEEHKSMSIHDKCDLFFHDYSVTPLFVQENYLNAVPHKPEAKNKIRKMELFARTARSLSFGDLTEKSIRSHNAWSLLPVQAVFSSLIPGDVLEGHLGAQINFPAWFGKNSRQTKMSRLVQELTVHSRLKISGNREAMLLDYSSPLESAIVTPLQRDGSDGVTAALEVLSEYCLVRDDLESISELCSWPGSKNQFAEVDSKVKAAFTRAYNKTSVPTPYATVPIKKGRRDADIVDGLIDEEEIGTQDMEEEEEGLETDAMIMVKKKPTGKKADRDVQPTTSKSSKASKRGKNK